MAVARPAAAPWSKLLGLTSPRELRLTATLENGQCFGWHRQPSGCIGDGVSGPVYVGVLGSRLLALRETDTDTFFRCLNAESAAAAEAGVSDEVLVHDELRSYFQLATRLSPLYDTWSAADERMATCARAMPGMRVLRQDPVECLFSFICSSNNNIARIGGMLQALRQRYGTPIPLAAEWDAAAAAAAAEEGGEEAEEAEDGQGGGPVGHGAARQFFSFPSAEALAAASEEELRGLGLGYRAAYVRQTAQMLIERGPEWLPSLRSNGDPDAVRAQLETLPGVGPKVADCVALFSLDQTGAIPVDTHVWDIACRDLDRTLTACGSLTPKVYARVGGLFRSAYGPHAGWAHSVLFAAELPQFRGRLPQETQDEMATFRAEGKAARAKDKIDKAEARTKAAHAKAKAGAAADSCGGGGEDEGDGKARVPTRKRKLSPTTVHKRRPQPPPHPAPCIG